MLPALALVPDSLCPTSIRVFTFIFSVSVSIIFRYSSNLFVMCWISFFVVLVYTPTCTFALYTHSALVINHSDLNIDIYRFGRYSDCSDAHTLVAPMTARTWATPFLIHQPSDVASERRALVILNQPFSESLLTRVWNASTWRACADGGANRLHDILDDAARERCAIRGYEHHIDEF
jgi:hypothetical protein